MKTTSRNDRRGSGGLLRKVCGACCRKIRAQIAGVKEAIFAETTSAYPAPERLVRLALNEAEAAAWQTKYPHLFFPTLAAEKVEAVAAWNVHQRLLTGQTRSVALGN